MIKEWKQYKKILNKEKIMNKKRKILMKELEENQIINNIINL